MENKTLHLTLKKKWFDMILSGEKKEEYREIKEYWKTRFCSERLNNFLFCDLCPEKNCYQNESGVSNYFSEVLFKNGYSSTAPEIIVECKGIIIKEGNAEWGAVDGIQYFVIQLGEILSTKNLNQ